MQKYGNNKFDLMKSLNFHSASKKTICCVNARNLKLNKDINWLLIILK